MITNIFVIEGESHGSSLCFGRCDAIVRMLLFVNELVHCYNRAECQNNSDATTGKGGWNLFSRHCYLHRSLSSSDAHFVMNGSCSSVVHLYADCEVQIGVQYLRNCDEVTDIIATSSVNENSRSLSSVPVSMTINEWPRSEQRRTARAKWGAAIARFTATVVARSPIDCKLGNWCRRIWTRRPCAQHSVRITRNLSKYLISSFGFQLSFGQVWTPLCPANETVL
ncbi:hypothetical protein T10_5187 [Trichinella papuae]|uniref:Uncharacterized protein n=1 Tax=Trichinella papuae TaxID=268474 RepID=A0A0V1MGJ3_9BILA|nr:hypothetical protein T10_5187 [Trichinella papuae]